MSISSANAITQQFECQRLSVKNGIEECATLFNLDPRHWIQEINTIGFSLEEELLDENLQDLALATAKAAMTRLVNFQWTLNAAKELSEQMNGAERKFSKLSRKIYPLKADLEQTIKRFAEDFKQSKETDSSIIKRSWKEIDDIDIEFQAIAALKEIKSKYKNFETSIQRCTKEGLSFNEDIAYAKDSVSSSQESIFRITSPKSPAAMNLKSPPIMPPRAQLYIATSGTQNTIARTETNVFIKYGMYRLESRISYYLKQRFFSQGGIDDTASIQRDIKKLKANAEEQLTWGEEGKPVQTTTILNLPEGIDPPANAPPPLLPLETIDAITDKFIKEARQLILYRKTP